MGQKELIITSYTSHLPSSWHSHGSIQVLTSQERIDEAVKLLSQKHSDRIVEPPHNMTNRIYLLEGGNVRVLNPIFDADLDKRKDTIYTYSLTKEGSEKIAEELGLPNRNSKSKLETTTIAG